MDDGANLKAHQVLLLAPDIFVAEVRVDFTPSFPPIPRGNR